MTQQEQTHYHALHPTEKNLTVCKLSVDDASYTHRISSVNCSRCRDLLDQHSGLRQAVTAASRTALTDTTRFPPPELVERSSKAPVDNYFRLQPCSSTDDVFPFASADKADVVVAYKNAKSQADWRRRASKCYIRVVVYEPLAKGVGSDLAAVGVVYP